MPYNTFPVLPGLAWGVTKTPEFKTDIFESLSGVETRVSYRSAPRYHYVLTYEFLRADANQELQKLLGFFVQQQGSMIPFYFTEPDTGNQVLVRFEKDTTEFSQFATLLWEAKQVQLVSLL